MISCIASFYWTNIWNRHAYIFNFLTVEVEKTDILICWMMNNSFHPRFISWSEYFCTFYPLPLLIVALDFSVHLVGLNGPFYLFIYSHNLLFSFSLKKYSCISDAALSKWNAFFFLNSFLTVSLSQTTYTFFNNINQIKKYNYESNKNLFTGIYT